MRRLLFTVDDARSWGLTPDALRWGERAGYWRRIERGVYAVGADDPSALDYALGAVLATGGAASGHVAGVLYELDSVELLGPDLTLPPARNGRRPGVRRRELAPERITTVDGFCCTDGLQTMIDLAASLDDLRWEQALESALRKGLLKIQDLAEPLPRFTGVSRVRRVLALRPQGAPPTESVLETLMVQLARGIDGLEPPTRQLEIFDAHGIFVGRPDLSWPKLGLFIELDGQRFHGQPIYDANRETAIVAATGWLCGRFTWTEVVRYPNSTRRRLAALVEQARRRPVTR